MVMPVPLPLQPEEVELLTPRDRMSVSQWAEKKRQLSSKTTDLHGPWSHDYTPYLVEVMDCLSDAVTREVVLMKCSQSGGTEAGLNFIGWAVDESPAPALMVMPREDDANRRVATRIRPMFESTPSLRQHLPGRRVDMLNTGKETILDNMIMYLAWAGSPAALADNPVCYVILDEVGKFPVKSGKEADPVSLAKKRQRTFFARSKLFMPSTPVLENDLIHREYLAGDQRSWWAKCPDCEKYHKLNWQHVQLDKTKDGKLLAASDYEAGGHARYACPECGSLWDETKRWQAVCDGLWVPAGCSVNDKGRIIGEIGSSTIRSYHIHALMLYPGFQTIDDLAAEWARAQIAKKTKDIGPLQDFINSQLGEPWVEAEKQTEDLIIRSHIGTYKAGIVPAGVQILTAGVDVQIDHVWVTVVGWGYLSEAWTIWSERIETGDTRQLENFDILRQFLLATWPLDQDPDRSATISKVAIDCGYRDDVVFDFCRAATEIDIVPVRGDDSVRAGVFRARKVAGATITRYDLNVNILKDRLYRLMYESTAAGPGYWHLHIGTTDEIIGHLSSEEQRVFKHRGRRQILWVLKKEHAANHIWDCSVYAAFAAELAGARTLRDPSAPAPQRKRRVGIRTR